MSDPSEPPRPDAKANASLRPPASSHSTEPSPSTSPPASLRQIIAAVLWSFFGIRKGKAMQRDAVSIKPHQVIIVGVLFAAVFVVTLLIVVRVITRSA